MRPIAELAEAAAATRFLREARQAPEVVRLQLVENAALAADLGARLRRSQPRFMITLGRGSSDHAATYARYLVETRLPVLTASAAPSVSSIYRSAPPMAGVLCLAISQSGRSPDLLAAAEAARDAGAVVVALVNDAASPLARIAEVCVPLRAGPELSVAATKSFIAALSAIVQITAAWSGDAALGEALARLPDTLEAAWGLDWSAAAEPLACARGLYVVGRGLGFAVAQEAALKLKEACGLHAEAFSGAEVRHGPMALVGPDFPLLVFTQHDAAMAGLEALAAAATAQGAPVFLAGGASEDDRRLPTVQTCAALEPIGSALSFYRLAALIALARQLNPDRPPHLSKVTETL